MLWEIKEQNTLRSDGSKMKNYFLAFWLIFIITGCDPLDRKLVISNESNQSVYYMWSPYDQLSTLYQKTLKEQGVQLTYLNCVVELEGNTSRNELLTGSKNAWEKYINSACENGKLRVFIFSLDTLKKYNWEEISTNQRYVSKKEFTVGDLKSLDWKIILP